jgi:tetratricopeptide (TPR) repeat protein
MEGLEGLLGAFEGSEAEAASAEAREEGLESAATAIAVEEAEKDPKAQPDAAAYLQSQKALVDLQIARFAEEHRLVHEERLLAIDAARRKRFADRLRNGLQVLVALAACAVTAAAAAMIIEAATSRSVVVDAFATPAALAPRGVTGEVVADGVLDQLSLLQAATRGAIKGLGATSAWSSDIKIEVPDTGVSIGEIDRVLRQRLGHDVHIGGDLVQTDAGGLELTVRGDGVPPKSFDGGAGDLSRLTQQAAEYVYGRSQPELFAGYLVQNNRVADAQSFFPGAVARARTDRERSNLSNNWGELYASNNQMPQAAAKFRLAMALEPNNWGAWGNLVGVLPTEEAEWRESQRFLKAVAAAPPGGKPELRLLQNAAQNVWDLPLLLESVQEDATHHEGAGTSTYIEGPLIADVYGLMHDPASAARYMGQSDPDNPTTEAEALLLPAYEALDRGDPVAALPSLEAFWKAWQASPGLQSLYTDPPCLAGFALGMAGRRAESEAVFARLGPLSRCYALHGDVLERSGDLAGAERLWAQGLAAAPDLPHVWLHRGLSELRRGDLASASADLAAANRSAPHFADPLKAWGDLLARQGRWREAFGKYDEALKYAPAWQALRQARDAARAKA